MSNKLITTSTLATALLLGGLNNSYANNLVAQVSTYGTDLYERVSEQVNDVVLSQPLASVVDTVGAQSFEQGFAATQVLAKRPPGKKGIQYQTSPQGDKAAQPYQYNKSRKSHRHDKTERRYRSDETSRPNQSRKPGSPSRVVSLDMSVPDSHQFVATYAAGSGRLVANETPRYIF